MEEPQTTTPTVHRLESSDKVQRQLVVFATLCAIASLLAVYQDFSSGGEAALIDTITIVGIVGCAIAVLMRPAWNISLVSLATLHVIRGFIAMPRMTTSQLLWMMCGAAIACSYLTHCIKCRSLVQNQNNESLLLSIAPCLRVMLVLSLTLIGFARLNWGFLSLETSSVAVILRALRDGQAPAEWVVFFTMSVLIICDIFLAIALLIPRLRRFAVGFGCTYFAWQAWIGFADARSLLPLVFALLYLFTAPELTDRIQETAARWIPFRWSGSLGIPIVSTIVVLVFVGLQFKNTAESALWSQRIVTLCYACFVLTWVGLLVSAMLDERQTRRPSVSFLVRNPLHYGILCLLAVAGLAPYFGLGTEASLTTASGLWTGPNSNNHLLMPQINLIDYQSDTVEILESSDPWLSQLAHNGDHITWFELVNYVDRRPNISLRFVRGEDEFVVERVGEITELSQPNPWVLRKLVGFRLVPDEAFLADSGRQIAQP